MDHGKGYRVVPIDVLREVNPIVRGWANFFRYCKGVKASSTSRLVRRGQTLAVDDGRNIRMQRVKESPAVLYNDESEGREMWREGTEEQFLAGWLTVQRYRFRMDETARLRHDLWRAECITKGACSVR